MERENATLIMLIQPFPFARRILKSELVQVIISIYCYNYVHVLHVGMLLFVTLLLLF